MSDTVKYVIKAILSFVGAFASAAGAAALNDGLSLGEFLVALSAAAATAGFVYGIPNGDKPE